MTRSRLLVSLFYSFLSASPLRVSSFGSLAVSIRVSFPLHFLRKFKGPPLFIVQSDSSFPPALPS